MSGGAYAAHDDPYCYRGIAVLKNRAGIRDQAALDQFESAMTAQRFDEAMPAGSFGVRHYRSVHRHIFQDIYPWAGRYRTIRISKGNSMFCYPQNIAAEMRRLFSDLRTSRHLRNLTANEFAVGAAGFLAILNAIHPFRDGNGRAQLAFLAMLANRAAHPLDLSRLAPERFLQAMIASFHGRVSGLRIQIRKLI